MTCRPSKIANNACGTEKKKLLKLDENNEDKVPRLEKEDKRSTKVGHKLNDTIDNKV